MVISSSVTAASTADGWDGGVVARFGGGDGTAVDASAGMEVRIGSGVGDVGRAVTAGLVPALAGTESGGGSRVGVAAAGGPSGGRRLDVGAGDGTGAVGCAGIGGVLAEIESSVATRDGVGTVVCAGTSGTLGETDSGV